MKRFYLELLNNTLTIEGSSEPKRSCPLLCHAEAIDLT